MANNYNQTHLCGSLYGKADAKCEHLLYVTEEGQSIGKKRLEKYYVYCLAESKVRSMGCAASWTGCSPKWCPKRKEKEAAERENRN